MEILAICVVVVALVALYVSADRSRTIAVVEIRSGVAKVVRGRLGARVMNEIRDVAERGRIARGRVVLRRESGSVRVDLDGIEDARAAQQLRNVIGRFRLAELRS